MNSIGLALRFSMPSNCEGHFPQSLLQTISHSPLTSNAKFFQPLNATCRKKAVCKLCATGLLPQTREPAKRESHCPARKPKTCKRLCLKFPASVFEDCKSLAKSI